MFGPFGRTALLLCLALLGLSVLGQSPTYAPPPSSALHYGRPHNRTSSPFAVLTSEGCAASLAYGSAALPVGFGVGNATQAPYFSSARASAFKSRVWHQIITRGGDAALDEHLAWSDVLLEIRWTFTSAVSKTRSDRFAAAVATGEAVTWEIVSHTASTARGDSCDGRPCEVRSVTGTWRLASGISSSDVAARLSATAASGFAPTGALWGAPTTSGASVDADAGSNALGWGVGVHSAAIATPEACVLVRNGVASSSSTAWRSYFFESPVWDEAAYYAADALLSEESYLFATTDAARCASALPFGPSPLSTSTASAAGVVLFSNAYADVHHHTWWQLIVEDSATTAPTWGEILLEIKWEFFDDTSYSTPSSKTMRQRFQDAVLGRGTAVNGEYVRWTIIDHSLTSSPKLVGTCAAGACDPTVRTGYWRWSAKALGVQDAFNGTGDGGATGGLGRRAQSAYPSQDDFGGLFAAALDNGGSVDGALMYGGDPSGWGVGTAKDAYDVSAPSGCQFVRLGLGARTNYAVGPQKDNHRSHLFVGRLALTTIPLPANARHFLTVDATHCAEALPYGPAPRDVASGTAGLTTSLAAARHSSWVQYVHRGAFDPRRSIVEATGWSDVLLEIRWNFSTHRTLRERLVHAVDIGEEVTWRVIVHRESGGTGSCAGGPCDDFTVSGTWRFSSAAANVSHRFDGHWDRPDAIGERLFDTSTSGLSFSTEDGQWGAARAAGAVVDGNAQANSMGWGVGNRRTTDDDTSGGTGCSSVVVTDASGSTSTSSYNDMRSIVYLEHAPTLHFERDVGHPDTRVLAVTDAAQCARTLPWGSMRLRWAIEPPKAAYFSNLASNATHRRWVQYVTTGATLSDVTLEWSDVLFEIEWTFDTEETVAARFEAAASTSGVHVTWTVIEHLDASSVVDTGACAGGKCKMYTSDGVWRFANGPSKRFDHISAGSAFSFGSGSGFWGDAGSAGASPSWGVGTVVASPGDAACGTVYRGGVATTLTSVRNVMHVVVTNHAFIPTDVVLPTMAPTMPPTLPLALSWFASLDYRLIGMIALPAMGLTLSMLLVTSICICCCCAVHKRKKKRSQIMNVYPVDETSHKKIEEEHTVQLNEHMVELKELHTLGILSDAELKAFEAGLEKS